MSRDETDTLLSQAARWRLLGLLFERPRRGWGDEVHARASEVKSERFAKAAREAQQIDEGPYLRVMGPGGTVSPREVTYRPMGDPGKILAELSGFYEAFGYDPGGEDPADHVAVEVGFVGFMKRKQAYAAARDDSTARRTAGAAIATFLADHLSLFAGDLARRMERGGLPHLKRAASILHEWCPGKPAPVAAPPGSSLPVDGDEELDRGGCAHH